MFVTLSFWIPWFRYSLLRVRVSIEFSIFFLPIQKSIGYRSFVLNAIINKSSPPLSRSVIKWISVALSLWNSSINRYVLCCANHQFSLLIHKISYRFYLSLIWIFFVCWYLFMYCRQASCKPPCKQGGGARRIQEGRRNSYQALLHSHRDWRWRNLFDHKSPCYSSEDGKVLSFMN